MAVLLLVRQAGLEPARPCGQQILSLLLVRSNMLKNNNNKFSF